MKLIGNHGWKMRKKQGASQNLVIDWFQNSIEFLFIVYKLGYPALPGPGVTHRCSHRTGCKSPDPTNFWESNMGGTRPKMCSKESIHYNLDPTIFSTPAVHLYHPRICGRLLFFYLLDGQPIFSPLPVPMGQKSIT